MRGYFGTAPYFHNSLFILFCDNPKKFVNTSELPLKIYEQVSVLPKELVILSVVESIILLLIQYFQFLSYFHTPLIDTSTKLTMFRQKKFKWH